MRSKTYNKRKLLFVFVLTVLLIIGLLGRLVYLMVFEAQYYQKKAEMLHEREREIKAARGEIVDANGTVLATNETVCTISVIYSQTEDKEQVIEVLSKELEIDEDEIRKKVEKVSSMETIKSNVSKEVGDRIRECDLQGVKVDEDFKRYYPFDNLASKVLGFTGADNQGIIGLEVEYEKYLKGTNGTILTMTDATGVDLEGFAEDRIEPINGKSLQISLDYNIQSYVQQVAETVMEEKSARAVEVIVMNPQNGEIMGMVNVPEFNLNEPFSLSNEFLTSKLQEGQSEETLSAEERQDFLNQMWRNNCISDTYEPGSTFKIMTAAAALEEGVVELKETFTCTGQRVVDGVNIHCHKYGGHGTQTFIEAVQNSCNPVFIEIGLRLGIHTFCSYYHQFGLLSLTNVDLPGEAATIMHKEENIKSIELATMAFGQSFQVTPIQMATTVSSIINGGVRVTPHLGVKIIDENGMNERELQYQKEDNIISKETSDTMNMILESVVSEGSGHNAYIEGYKIGGKTATSQTLPRSANVYISSFIGYAPTTQPEVLVIALVEDPKGTYYGSAVVAPVVKEILQNILPYLGMEKAEIETRQDDET